MLDISQYILFILTCIQHVGSQEEKKKSARVSAFCLNVLISAKLSRKYQEIV